MKEWKKIIIDGIETNYSVSTDGNIRNDNTNRILKQRTCNEYKRVSISLGHGNMKNLNVHRLVAIAFIENKDNKPCVNHINANKTDNILENLEWCSYSENSLHSHKLGLQTSRKGIENNKSKLTEEQVLQIRNEYNNISSYRLSKIFNVYATTVQSVKKRKTWKHI